MPINKLSVKVLSPQFTRERETDAEWSREGRDKTGINRADVKVQTVEKSSLLENMRMAEVKPGQSLAGERSTSQWEHWRSGSILSNQGLILWAVVNQVQSNNQDTEEEQTQDHKREQAAK